MRQAWIKGVALAALVGVSIVGAAHAQTRSETADFADVAATRGRIAVGETVSGSLTPGGDKDWYRINVQAGQTYRAALSSAGEGDAALGDPLLRVLDRAGEEIARDDDSGDGLNSYVEFTASSAGVYYLEARGFGDDATGAYMLRLLQGDVPADASTDLTLSLEGDYRDGRLSPAGDKDWYGVDLTQGQTVRLALNTGATEGVGDPMMVIYNSAGAEIARDDDGGGELNSYLEFTAPAAGRYFVEARGFSDEAEGAYTLTLTPGEIGNNAETADSVAANGMPRQSTLGAPDDADWFGIDMVEGRAYRIFLDPAGEEEAALADPLLTLFDSEGAQLAQDDDGGLGTGSRIAFVAPTSGVFYAAASAYANQGGGHYTIRAVDSEVPGNPGTDEMLDGAEDTRESRIDMSGDKDWYGVQVSAGQTYRFAADGSGSARLANPAIALFSDEGESVASDDDGGPGRNALLDFNATKDGLYYVQVTGAAGQTGDYTLSVTNTTAH